MDEKYSNKRFKERDEKFIKNVLKSYKITSDKNHQLCDVVSFLKRSNSLEQFESETITNALSQEEKYFNQSNNGGLHFDEDTIMAFYVHLPVRKWAFLYSFNDVKIVNRNEIGEMEQNETVKSVKIPKRSFKPSNVLKINYDINHLLDTEKIFVKYDHSQKSKTNDSLIPIPDIDTLDDNSDFSFVTTCLKFCCNKFVSYFLCENQHLDPHILCDPKWCMTVIEKCLTDSTPSVTDTQPNKLTKSPLESFETTNSEKYANETKSTTETVRDWSEFESEATTDYDEEIKNVLTRFSASGVKISKQRASENVKKFLKNLPVNWDSIIQIPQTFRHKPTIEVDYGSKEVDTKIEKKSQGFLFDEDLFNDITLENLFFLEEEITQKVKKESIYDADNEMPHDSKKPKLFTIERDEPEWDIDRNNPISPNGRFYRYRSEIGRGAYKLVFQSVDAETGINLAWCELKNKMWSNTEIKKFVKEANLLKVLHHQNIVRYYDFWNSSFASRNIVLITDLLSSGTLKDYIDVIKSVSKNMIKMWGRQILRGLRFLHSKKPPIIHRDLKCDNIFISGTSGLVKIGDLGLAGIKHTPMFNSVIGTPQFMAPEMYEECYDERIDIYSFGMCLLEMCTGLYPYNECSNAAQVFKKVMAGIKPQVMEQIQDTDLYLAIDSCLKKRDQRITLQELLDTDLFSPSTCVRVEIVKDQNLKISRKTIQMQLLVTDKLERVDSQKEGDAIRFEYVLAKDTPEKLVSDMVQSKLIRETLSKYAIRQIKDLVDYVLKMANSSQEIREGCIISGQNCDVFLSESRKTERDVSTFRLVKEKKSTYLSKTNEDLDRKVVRRSCHAKIKSSDMLEILSKIPLVTKAFKKTESTKLVENYGGQQPRSKFVRLVLTNVCFSTKIIHCALDCGNMWFMYNFNYKKDTLHSIASMLYRLEVIGQYWIRKVCYKMDRLVKSILLYDYFVKLKLCETNKVLTIKNNSTKKPKKEFKVKLIEKITNGATLKTPKISLGDSSLESLNVVLDDVIITDTCDDAVYVAGDELETTDTVDDLAIDMVVKSKNTQCHKELDNRNDCRLKIIKCSLKKKSKRKSMNGSRTDDGSITSDDGECECMHCCGKHVLSEGDETNDGSELVNSNFDKFLDHAEDMISDHDGSEEVTTDPQEFYEQIKHQIASEIGSSSKYKIEHKITDESTSVSSESCTSSLNIQHVKINSDDKMIIEISQLKLQDENLENDKDKEITRTLIRPVYRALFEFCKATSNFTILPNTLDELEYQIDKYILLIGDDKVFTGKDSKLQYVFRNVFAQFIQALGTGNKNVDNGEIEPCTMVNDSIYSDVFTNICRTTRGIGLKRLSPDSDDKYPINEKEDVAAKKIMNLKSKRRLRKENELKRLKNFRKDVDSIKNAEKTENVVDEIDFKNFKRHSFSNENFEVMETVKAEEFDVNKYDFEKIGLSEDVVERHFMAALCSCDAYKDTLERHSQEVVRIKSVHSYELNILVNNFKKYFVGNILPIMSRTSPDEKSNNLTNVIKPSNKPKTVAKESNVVKKTESVVNYSKTFAKILQKQSDGDQTVPVEKCVVKNTQINIPSRGKSTSTLNELPPFHATFNQFMQSESTFKGSKEQFVGRYFKDPKNENKACEQVDDYSTKQSLFSSILNITNSSDDNNNVIKSPVTDGSSTKGNQTCSKRQKLFFHPKKDEKD